MLIFGMELMDTVDYTMPIRKLLYDAQEYQRQLQQVIRNNRAKARYLSEQGKQDSESGSEKFWNHGGEFLYGFRKEDRVTSLITVALYCAAGT